MMRFPDFPGLQVTLGLLFTNSSRGIREDVFGGRTSVIDDDTDDDNDDDNSSLVKTALGVAKV